MATPRSLMDIANCIAYDAVQRLDCDEIQELHRICEDWHDGPKSAMYAFAQFIQTHNAVKPSVFKRLPSEAVDAVAECDQYDEKGTLMKLRDFAQELAGAVEAATQMDKLVRKAMSAGVSPILLAEIASKATAPRNNP